MAGSGPYMTGGEATIQVFIDGKTVDSLNVESWELTHNVEEVKDDICGEDASRLDVIHNFWSLSITSFIRNEDVLRKYLKYHKDVASQSTPEQAVGIKLVPRGKGAAALFVLEESCLGGIGLSVPGRTGRNKVKLPIRGRRLSEMV